MNKATTTRNPYGSYPGHPCRYDVCPACGGKKHKIAAMCKPCRLAETEERLASSGIKHVSGRYFSACPKCGGDKQKVSRMCRKCHAAEGHPKWRGVDFPIEDREGFVYKVTNAVNGKIYVGKTTIGVHARMAQHICNAKRGCSAYLYQAMRKHGADKFSVELLDTATSQLELDAKEIKSIAELQSTDCKKGYNCTPGGEGAPHGPSSRTFRSKGVPRTPEVRAKISAAQRGKKRDPAHMEKLFASVRGRKQTPEEIAKRVESNRRKWKEKSPEEIAEHGRKIRERWANNPEYREKLLAKLHNRQRTPEGRKAFGDKMRAFWASPAATDAKNKMRERVAAMDHSASTKKAWQTRRAKAAMVGV